MTQSSDSSNTPTEGNNPAEGAVDNNVKAPADDTNNVEIQQKVDAAVRDRLQRESAKTDAVQKQLDEALEKVTQLSDIISDNTSKFEEVQLENVQLGLALAEGVTVDLIKTLKGSTIEELAENLKVVKTANTTNSSHSGFKGKEYNSEDQSSAAISAAILKKFQK